MKILPEPIVDHESEAFYAAADEGRFMLRRCTDCGEAHWYPRAACPFCGGATAWEEVSGQGTLYSYSVMAGSHPPPILAYVTLAEGPTMLTNIVDTPAESLHIGQAVTLAWQAAGTRKAPCFCAADNKGTANP